MSCEGVLGSIVALLDGELNGDERRTVELHVGACAACRGELELLRATRVLVAGQLATAGAEVTVGSFDDLWHRVEALAEGDEGPVGLARTGRSSAAALRVRAVKRPWISSRGRVAAWAGGAGLAMAASLALMIVGRRAVEVAPVPRADKPVAVARAAAPAAASRPAPEQATRLAAARTAPAGAPAANASTETAPVDGDATPESEVAVVANEIDPPRELMERPELFVNYPIVRRLDELRHLESVLAESPDAGGSG